MAATKIKPIRGIVNKALGYILDPAKTDDQLYVSLLGVLPAMLRSENLSGHATLLSNMECRCRK